jgi:hypothetical protein
VSPMRYELGLYIPEDEILRLLGQFSSLSRAFGRRGERSNFFVNK